MPAIVAGTATLVEANLTTSWSGRQGYPVLLKPFDLNELVNAVETEIG